MTKCKQTPSPNTKAKIWCSVVCYLLLKIISFLFINVTLFYLLHNHRSRRTNIAHSAHLDRETTTARHVCECVCWRPDLLLGWPQDYDCQTCVSGRPDLLLGWPQDYDCQTCVSVLATRSPAWLAARLRLPDMCEWATRSPAWLAARLRLPDMCVCVGHQISCLVGRKTTTARHV